MKKLLLTSIVLGFCLLINPGYTQNYQNNGQLGLPGDNLNLYGVLSLFQESKTLEEFEQKLNVEDSKINNLDLDGDNRTDYIKVIDNVNGNAHVIVLRDMLTANESQDVAVIEVEKDRNNQIQIQIIGDEALYGKNYIIEPAYNTPNPGYIGNNNSGSHTVYEYNNYYTNSNVGYGSNYMYTIGAWSIIHYIFAPNYIVYNSPWRYGYYPHYWRPWRTVYYDDYYGHWHNHNSYQHFRHTQNYSVPTAHNYYGPRRTMSTNVHTRIDRGDYKRTYENQNRNGRTGHDRTMNNTNNRNSNEQYNNNRRTTPDRTTTTTTTRTTTNPTYNNNDRGGRKTEATTNTNNDRGGRRSEAKTNTNSNNNANDRSSRRTEAKSGNSERATSKPAERKVEKREEKKVENKGSEKRK